MTYEEKHAQIVRKEEERKARQAKQVADLMAEIGQNGENINDEVRKRFFKYWGWCNGWNDEDGDQFNLAWIAHQLDQKNHPELHTSVYCSDANPLRGYYHDKCSCGFEHACDCSD